MVTYGLPFWKDQNNKKKKSNIDAFEKNKTRLNIFA